jgi:AraC family transcriptional regulator, regulatory protein of adaptative response / methylated-DNA-[protein]-cysteine methyltransferase
MSEFTIQYDALRRRDPALDGVMFAAVKTTGIYCRPVCPARTPHARNVRFYPSAAAAERAGYRPCLRCRPETAPFARPGKAPGRPWNARLP